METGPHLLVQRAVEHALHGAALRHRLLRRSSRLGIRRLRRLHRRLCRLARRLGVLPLLSIRVTGVWFWAGRELSRR